MHYLRYIYLLLVLHSAACAVKPGAAQSGTNQGGTGKVENNQTPVEQANSAQPGVASSDTAHSAATQPDSTPPGYTPSPTAQSEMADRGQAQLLTGVPFMPDELTFAGEAVPLTDPIVRDRLERELIKNVYRHSGTLSVMKRVQRYREPITTILTKNQIPADFLYLAVAESDLSPIAESAKAAVGFWQFLEPVAKEYGLEVNKYVDERRHLERSTEAASRYLSRLYRTFGSWTLSAAAYNGGPTAVNNNLRGQQVTSYYDLYLTPETYDYLFRILALKLLIENPERYGFSVPAPEYTAPTQEIEVRQDVNLVDLAKQYNMTYNQLKYFNPWLLYRSGWSPSDKYYDKNRALNVMLEVPAGKVYRIQVLK
ncbi:lytic transglycosylase domain-containing protein [Telluribacter sp. SYSU D00476]|uniref:lytic transglycosylase domain-containing protein n=1 Tax=Telluribacter sp. SYSU D00476 TaxID=2811430 RepID=UPI001FF38535|nr:lytic transglycosylase domain-containing protein [Telluribacter sp. SYSU D00476]